jgi:hypothetical protein
MMIPIQNIGGQGYILHPCKPSTIAMPDNQAFLLFLESHLRKTTTHRFVTGIVANLYFVLVAGFDALTVAAFIYALVMEDY